MLGPPLHTVQDFVFACLCKPSHLQCGGNRLRQRTGVCEVCSEQGLAHRHKKRECAPSGLGSPIPRRYAGAQGPATIPRSLMLTSALALNHPFAQASHACRRPRCQCSRPYCSLDCDANRLSPPRRR
eukprot:scaffold75381_cov37-Tisochrysis_lutea.AAC.3